MSESETKEQICNELRKYGHISQIESHATATGFPDINFCINNVEGNIELKHGNLGHDIKIRPSQRRWFKQRVDAGGNCWLLGRFQYGAFDLYVLVHGRHIKLLTNKYASWVKVQTKSWMDKMDYEELANIITAKEI